MSPYRTIPDRTADDPERQILRIRAAGDVAGLVELLPFLPPEAHRLGPQAALAATAVLEQTRPERVAWFEQLRRTAWPSVDAAPAWTAMRPLPLLGLTARWPRAWRGVVALASLHGSGFVREDAVRTLA